MKYEFAWDIQSKMREIVAKLGMNHVLVDNVVCIRGSGSQSRRTIARCHALNKIMQKALNRKGFYVLEFLAERYDRMIEEDKIKVIIHELMHIPKTFGGGFKFHDYVTDRNVNVLYQKFMGLNQPLSDKECESYRCLPPKKEKKKWWFG